MCRWRSAEPREGQPTWTSSRMTSHNNSINPTPNEPVRFQAMGYLVLLTFCSPQVPCEDFILLERWSRRRELNPRPTVYETVALPLSYAGMAQIKMLTRRTQRRRRTRG